MSRRIVNVNSDYSAAGIEVHIHSAGNLTGGGSRSRVKFYSGTERRAVQPTVACQSVGRAVTY